MPDLRLTVPFSFNKADIKKKNSLMQLVDRPPGCFHCRLQANSLVFSNMTILVFSFSPSLERLQGSTFKSWPKWCGRTFSGLPRVSLEKLCLRCVVSVLRKWLDHPIIQCHNVATWTKIPLDYPKDWVTYPYGTITFGSDAAGLELSAAKLLLIWYCRLFLYLL